jgi:cytochrome c5
MKKLLSLIFLVILAGCTAIEVLAPPVDRLFISEAKISAKEAAYLAKGRKVYMKFCTRCHSPWQVDQITPKLWKSHVPKMYKKAKLYPEEQKPLEAYIKTAARINQRLIARREAEKK